MWDYEDDWDFEYTFVNNRKAYHGYDFDGREVMDPRTNADGNAILFSYDAAGQMWKTERYYSGYETTFGRDGTGQELKRSQRIYDSEEEEWGAWESSYFINSSVLGQTVSETTSTGKKKFTYVIGGGMLIARQAIDDEDDEYVSWEHRDASGFSSGSSSAGSIPIEVMLKPEEMDALGNNVGTAPALTIRPRGNSNSPNEPAAFDDPNASDCNSIGVYGGCFRDSPFALNNDGLPREIGQAARTGRDSYTVARDVMRSIYGPLGPEAAPLTLAQRGAIIEGMAPSDIDEWWEEFMGQANSSGGDGVVSMEIPNSESNCKLTIAISDNHGLTGNQLDVMKSEIGAIFDDIGIETSFVSEDMSSDYWLSVNSERQLTTTTSAGGATPTLPGLFRGDPRRVANFGEVIANQLVRGSRSNFVSAYIFDKDPHRFLAVALGRAGAHEIGHYLLQQNYDSQSISGVMRAAYTASEWFGDSSGIKDLWRFNTQHRQAIRSRLCSPGTRRLFGPQL